MSSLYGTIDFLEMGCDGMVFFALRILFCGCWIWLGLVDI
jgi:hypothetical protein